MNINISAVISRNPIHQLGAKTLSDMLFNIPKDAIFPDEYRPFLEQNHFRPYIYFVNECSVFHFSLLYCREAAVSYLKNVTQFLNNFSRVETGPAIYSEIFIILNSGRHFPSDTERIIEPRIKYFIDQFLVRPRYFYDKDLRSLIRINKEDKSIAFPAGDTTSDWRVFSFTTISLLIHLLRHINLFVKPLEEGKVARHYMNYNEVINKCREILSTGASQRTLSEGNFCSGFGWDTFYFMILQKCGLLYPTSKTDSSANGPNTYIVEYREVLARTLHETHESSLLEICKYYGDNIYRLLEAVRNDNTERRITNLLAKPK